MAPESTNALTMAPAPRSQPLPFPGLRRHLTHDWHIVRRRELAQMKKWLRLRPTYSACDIGCGDAYYTQELLRGCASITGIDVDRANLASFQMSGTRIALAEATAERLPFKPDAFDVIIGVCAMEHFEDDIQALRAMKRTLRPAGQLILSVDSLSVPGIPARDIERHRKQHYVNNLYTLEGLKAKFEAVGLAVKEHRYIVTSPFAYRLVSLANRMWKGLNILFPVFYPLILVADWISGSKAPAGYILIVRAGHAD